MGRGPKPAKGKAKPAVARKSPKSDGAKLRDLDKRLAEALRDKAEAQEQQAATVEILHAIRCSPTDLEPVFQTIAQRAKRLCNARECAVFRFDGALIHLVAQADTSASWATALRSAFPRPPGRGSITARAVLTRSVVHVADVLADPDYDLVEASRSEGIRSVLSVPILRDGEVVGVITVDRRQPQPFLEAQIALVKTFADQAVIAIENVRLFNETKEALEQQTATAEILRVISSSPTDIKPVLDAVARSAMRLCESYDAMIMLREGEELHFPVHHGPIWPTVQLAPRAISRGWVAGRAVLDRQPVHVHDLATVGAEFPVGQADAVRAGYRTTLSVPLLREGEAIGVIHIRRREVRPFTDNQIALLQTFAAQAVIAIENVRLFKELEEKNQALTAAHTQVTETLEQQTATSEVLRVIASSPTDVQPVFDAIVRSAVRLCDGLYGSVASFDGELIHLIAQYNYSPEAVEILRRTFPIRPGRAFPMGRAIMDCAVAQIPDIERDPEYEGVHLARAIGARSVLVVPMLHNGKPIGGILVARAEVGPFSDKQIALLKTFADQAVIAIENVRLFNETKEALEQQTATGEILGVISNSPTDVQPVFDAVAGSAMRLCQAEQAVVVTFDGEVMHLAALSHFDSRGVEAMRQTFPIRADRGSVLGRAVVSKTVAHIPSLMEDPEYRQRGLAQVAGFRGGVAVPMLKDGRATGAIGVARLTPGPFTDRQIELLKTFADQAVIAIENVRLFTKLQTSNRDLTTALEQQTATSELLKVIGRSTFDLQPVFETLAENAVRLCEAEHALIFRFDDEVLKVVATYNIAPELRAFNVLNPSCLGAEAAQDA
jgi:GAF domain-containing protein